jgi:hypothetical protein
MQEMTLGAAATRPDRAAQPSSWAALLRNLLFRAAVLVNEAGLVLVSGNIVSALFGNSARLLPAPSVLAVAYAVIAVAVGAYAQPPRHSRRTAALRVLLAISAMALLVTTRPLAALPPRASWLILSFATISSGAAGQCTSRAA